jgi:hypothetical protein
VNFDSHPESVSYSLSAGSFPAPKIGPPKWTFFFDPPNTNISAGSLLKTPKTESKLAKFWQENSHKGFNIEFEMRLSPQETR